MRVTSDEVKAILETSDQPINFDLTPFILLANLRVTGVISGEGVSDDVAKEMERWLAAHFACVRRRRTVEEQYGGARERYKEERGQGLMSTDFGQMVAELDPTGKLINAIKPKVILQALDVLNPDGR